MHSIAGNYIDSSDINSISIKDSHFELKKGIEIKEKVTAVPGL